MSPADFAKLLASIHAREKKILGVKEGEYSRQGDRLHNFKKAGALQSCTPERALGGMNAKHLVSIADMVNDLDAGVDHPWPVWEEKLTDARNYLALLEGLLRERYPIAGR